MNYEEKPQESQEARESVKKYRVDVNGVIETFESLDDLKTFVESLRES